MNNLEKLEMCDYLANSANCLGSLRSRPGIPSGGILFPVMYSSKSGSKSGLLASSV